MNSIDGFRHTTIPLAHDAGALPAVGFGTLIPDREAARRAIKVALEVGFRHLDAAEAYRNEDVVGHVMKEASANGTVRREDLFVTSKLWNNNHRPERVRPALEASLRRLQLDHVDAYLIHTPFAFAPGEDQYPKAADGKPLYDTGVTLVETWKAMERLVDDGLCKSIGLSDVHLGRVREIVANARIKPAIVQVESHPYLPEWELLEFCRENGIVLQAFAPLGHGMAPRPHPGELRHLANAHRGPGRDPDRHCGEHSLQRGRAHWHARLHSPRASDLTLFEEVIISASRARFEAKRSTLDHLAIHAQLQ